MKRWTKQQFLVSTDEVIVLEWGLFVKMATDWEVSEVGDTCRPAAGPGRGRSVQIEWISAGTAHLGFPALWSVPHLLSREIKMNRRHCAVWQGSRISKEVNRPIVLLRPGHKIRGIPGVCSCKKHCFLYFSEALSLPSMALNDCFFFQLAWKTQLMFGDVLVQHWHWKKSRFERLSPLPESPVSRNRSGSVVLTWAPHGRHSRGTIYLTPEKKCSFG